VNASGIPIPASPSLVSTDVARGKSAEADWDAVANGSNFINFWRSRVDSLQWIVYLTYTIAKSESKCKSEIELEGTSEEISVFVDILASFSTLFVARM
jgi:hypothetical protein